MKQNHSVKIRFSSFLSLLFSLLILCSCSVNVNNNSDSESAFQKGILNIHFLDVGQGDSIFIELPDEKTMLIDAGENYHGEGIKNYIGDCGYSKIDYLVATHPHADHIGSMSYIVRNMDIGSVYMPKAAANTKTYENLLESISDKGLRITSAKSGLTIAEESDYTINVVAPVTIDEDNLNNSSAVIKLTYKDNTFLFTGDAEKKELETITYDISADVLKVGHHGSTTSTTEEFLNAVNPTYAVISAGENNSYGHPHKETLDLLEEFNCKIYRTDIDKTVVFSSDGETISVKSGEQSIKKAG
ncbi:MAG: ComEC/Rec2 family competence protein [Ruminococcus sp.]